MLVSDPPSASETPHGPDATADSLPATNDPAGNPTGGELGSAVPRRGRPVGWTLPTFADLGTLTLEDFAFTRAVVGGMAPTKAWRRFYANRHFDAQGQATAPHGHVVNAHARRLLDQILAAAAQSADAAVRAMGVLLARELPVDGVSEADKSKFHSSYNDWLETLSDPGAWGERELVGMYQEYLREQLSTAPPSPANEDSDPVAAAEQVSQRSLAIQDKVRAINHLQTVLASRPLPEHATAQWLAPPLQVALARLGVRTMGEFTHFVAAGGRHWHRPVAKLGPGRAARLLAWLDDHAETLGRIDRTTPRWQPKPALQTKVSALQEPPTPLLMEDAQSGVMLPSSALPSRGTAIAPFEWLIVPAHLDGSTGLFRSRTPNHYGARTDYEAVRTWLASFHNAGKARTFEAYRREIERFYLWCLLEASTPISGVSLAHAMAYQAFLRHIPAAYISAERVTREDPRWRPWRGQLSARSQAYALGVVSQFYNDAVRNAYLSGNPFASLRTPALAERVMDTSRSLSEQDLQWVRECVLNLPAPDTADALVAALTRRTRLILQLALTTGLRLQEMAAGTLLHARRAIVDGVEQDDEWLIEVCGKGGKKRYVPLSGAVYRLIREHHADVEAQLERAGAGATARLQTFQSRPPLICALRAPAGHRSVLLDGRAEMANDNLALGRVGLYRTLKAFFRVSARRPLRAAQRELAQLRQLRHAPKGETPVAQLQAGKEREAELLREIQTWQRRASVSTHWLRHTFAKAVLQANPDDSGLKLAQQLLGHASINTTQIYLRQDESAKVRAVRRVNPLGL